MSNFLEIETKYDASEIDRIAFKSLVRTLSPSSFLYVESRDIYYTKGDGEFLRYRMASESDQDKRSELTFKKKHVNSNNIVRTEVNLRVDQSSPETIEAFCQGLGYSRNFSIYKMCDIYFFDDANVVLYSVVDDSGKAASFLEIEVREDLNISSEQAWAIIVKYEKALQPLGISAQKRKKLSLFEMYRRENK